MRPFVEIRSTATRRPPRWSARVPSLAAAYLEWLNHHANRRFMTLAGALALGAVCGAVGLVWTYRDGLVSTLIKLERHTATLALFAAVVSALAVARRRSSRAARAERSWLAALPVGLAARRLETGMLSLAPIAAALLLSLGLGLLTCALIGLARLPTRSGITVLCWLLGGAVVGAVAGMAIPSPKPEVSHPGSRYVPHRVTRRTPAPSLMALGIWPIRRLFAVLQPKMVSRTLIPVLLAVPLGSTAAAAMIWIGEFGLLAALAILGASIVWVWRAARMWLRPLPLSPLRLLAHVGWRALLFMTGFGATALWLGGLARS